MNHLTHAQIRQGLLLLLISGLFGVLFWNLREFLPALLGAYTLYVLLSPAMRFLTERWQWPHRLAAAALMALSFALIMLPVNAIVRLLNVEVSAALARAPEILASVGQLVRGLESQYGLALWTPDNLASATGWLSGQITAIFSATMIGLLLVLVAYFMLWFMLTSGAKMEASFFNWLPLKAENIAYVRRELHQLVYVNALGIPVMGLAQGLAGLLAYSVAGVDAPFLWALITFIAGMMPIFGAAMAYVPLALVLLAQGQAGTALGIFLYGIVVVGSVDNLARMWFLHKIGHAHPLVTLFGVVVGLKLFGFIGFIFGPILIALFRLLVKIYGKEFAAAGS